VDVQKGGIHCLKFEFDVVEMLICTAVQQEYGMTGGVL
jgi:hypothetical protein